MLKKKDEAHQIRDYKAGSLPVSWVCFNKLDDAWFDVYEDDYPQNLCYVEDKLFIGSDGDTISKYASVKSEI